MMGKAEIEQYKKDIDIEELKTLLEDILKQIVVVDLDYLYELQGYVENLIDNFKEFSWEEDD